MKRMEEKSSMRPITLSGCLTGTLNWYHFTLPDSPLANFTLLAS